MILWHLYISVEWLENSPAKQIVLQTLILKISLSFYFYIRGYKIEMASEGSMCKFWWIVSYENG